MRRKPDRTKGDAPVIGPTEASSQSPLKAIERTDGMNFTSSTHFMEAVDPGLDQAPPFPFSQKAAQRLRSLQPGQLAAMLTTQGGEALTGWMTSFSDATAAIDRLISQFGRSGVCLRVEEVLR